MVSTTIVSNKQAAGHRTTGNGVRTRIAIRMSRSGVVAVAIAAIAAGALATTAIGAAKSSTVSLRSTPAGKVVVAANGRTLYLFTADKGRKSACYGQCASVWRPLVASRPSAGTGLKASLLATTKRKDGHLQVTYGGHPLYFFAPDKKAGDVKGQGVVHFGGAWWVVSAGGSKITKKAG
jgi:predicted lipoprotein with Yx(FWY)xxD motif